MHSNRRLRVAAALALLVAPGLLVAQTPPAAPASEDQTVKLTTFVVTGSNIPTAADATDVPVTVLGAHDIQDTGVNSNFLDMMRKAIPAFAGRSDIGNSNGTNNNQNT